MIYQKNIEDIHITSLLHDGKQEGIAVMYDKFHAALYGAILKIVQNDELAEEVLQDTFMKAWRSRESYDATKGKLFTWLLNIARNTAIDYTRLKSFSQKKQDIDSALFSIDKSENASFNEDIIGVKEMVANMPKDQRVLIELVYFQGFTHVEAAEHLDMPLGTVKTRIRNGIGELRKYFNVLILLFLKTFFIS